jgi:hypothetical protein
LTQIWHISKWRKTITCAIGIANMNMWNLKHPKKVINQIWSNQSIMSKIYQKEILEWKMPITSKGIHRAYGKNFAI